MRPTKIFANGDWLYGSKDVAPSNPSLNYLTSADAINFIRFIYNDSGRWEHEVTYPDGTTGKAHLTDEAIIESDQYKLLTGQLAYDEELEEAAGLAFIAFVEERVNANVESSSAHLEYLRSDLQEYMEYKLDGMAGLPDEMIGEYKNKAFKTLKEGILDYLVGAVGEATGIYVTGEMLEDIELSFGVYDDIMDLGERVENFVRSAKAVVQAGFVPLTSELNGRYSYFASYVNCRSLGEPGSDAFDLAMDYNFMAATENASAASLLINCIPGKSSWTECRDTIDRWGEYTYQLNQSFKHDNGGVAEPEHVHFLVSHPAVSATCESAGRARYFECASCGELFSDEGGQTSISSLDAIYVPSFGHDWGEGTVTTAPTCTAAGVLTFTCKNDASHVRTEAVAALGHDHVSEVVAATWDEGGYTKHACSRCGDEYVTDRTPALRELAGDGGGEESPALVSIAKAKVAGLKARTYTGKAIAPVPTVEVGGVALKNGVDFTLSYKNNVKAGTATVTVTGKGGYTGSVDATFKIAPASVSSASVALSRSGFTYNAKKQVPTVKSVKLGSTALKPVADYTVSCLNASKKNIAASKVVGAGVYYVKVAGKGNYTGSAVRKFTITKATNPMKVAGKKAGAKYDKRKPRTVKASAAYKFSKKAVGAVTYSRVAKGSSKWLPKVNAKTGAVTVKAAAPKGKTYSVNVKVAAKGDGNYKPASKVVTVKVKVK